MEPARNPELDDLIASEGPAQGVLEVYADWLAQQGEAELARSFADDRLAAAGDRAARARVLTQRSELPQSEGVLCFEHACGFVVGLNVAPRCHYDPQKALWHLDELLYSDGVRLLGRVRVELLGPEEEGVDAGVIARLALLPPTVGRLSIVDPRAPADPRSPVDLGEVTLPGLRQLRIRAGSVQRWPPHLQHLRVLELGVADPGPVEALDLPALETLHLWAGLPDEAVSALLQRTPALKTLGLHGPACREALLRWSLPAHVSTLVLSLGLQARAEGGAPDRRALSELARQLPPTVRSVRLPWIASGELPAPFVGGSDPTAPIYL